MRTTPPRDAHRATPADGREETRVFCAPSGGWARLAHLVLAVAIWAVFNPGITGDDGLGQLRQAETGRYTNYHPPVMSLLTRAVYRVAGLSPAAYVIPLVETTPAGRTSHDLVIFIGGSLGLVTFLQSVAGLYGIRFLCLRLLRRLRGAARGSDEWLALLCAVLLLAFTPLPFYLVAYLKDSWLLIELLWLAGILVSLEPTSAAGWATVSAAVAITVLVGLTRHNAVVVLAAVCPLVYRGAARWKGLMAVAPVALLLLAQRGIERTADVVDLKPAHQVLLLDLVGMSVLEPRLMDEMPFVSRHMTTREYARIFQPGAQGLLPMVMDLNGAQWSDPAALRAEYRRVASRHPVLLLKTKLKAFHNLIRPPLRMPYLLTGIWSSGRGYSQNPGWAPARTYMEQRYTRLTEEPLGRLLNAHPLWLVAGAGLLLLALWRLRSPGAALILAVPVLYANSFLLATTSFDYRFLYPATAVFQVVTVVSVFVWVRWRMKRTRTQEAPASRAFDTPAAWCWIVFAIYAGFILWPFFVR